MRTSSFAKDNYARRKNERQDASIEQLTEGLSNVSVRMPQYQLWGTYVQEASVSKPTISPSDFTVEEGMPATIEGAKRFLLTIDGVRYSSGSSSEAANKFYTLTVTGAEDVELIKISDGNRTISSEVFSVGNNLDGVFSAEVYSFNGNKDVQNENPVKACGVKNLTGSGLFSTPAIKSFSLAGANNNTNYAPVTYKVYVEF